MISDLTDIGNILPSGGRALCAVSGGADSMCLLHLMYSNQARLGVEVCAAHFEHGLRGEESLRDARFVEAWCRERDIPLFLGRGDVRAYAGEKGLGIEEAARELRYAFLEKTAEEQNCNCILTAHNADDNAETMLFNLTRGSGSTGLGGIPPVRGNIVRPLLRVTRSEIDAYLEQNGIPHVEDSSNASDDYSRNLIRHKVLPVLRQINGDCAQSMGRAAALLRQDEDFILSQSRIFIDKYYDGESLPAAELGKLHPAVSSRVIRKLCKKSLGQNHVDAVLALAGSRGLAYADVPGQRLRYEQGRLYFTDGGGGEISPRRIIAGETVRIEEAGVALKADITFFTEEINGLFKTYCFKYDNICGNIFCTGKKNGDSLRPAGRNCTKTLKSLFTEAKMTQQQRLSVPVLRDDKGVLAVLGMAADERTLAQAGDKVLRIQIENI